MRKNGLWLASLATNDDMMVENNFYAKKHSNYMDRVLPVKFLPLWGMLAVQEPVYMEVGYPGWRGNPLKWGNPPAHIISHINLITFTG